MGERARTDLKPLAFSGGVDMEVEPNDYDKVRKIIPFRDSRSLAIGARTLSTEMSCPICLDLLSQTMTAKECLHRFCSECITMALQRGNKECPTCRKKLVSKRSLRPDPSFDLLISKVWPDRSIYDNLQQHELEFGREESPEEEDNSGEATPTDESGASLPKKKKTGTFDPDSLMEYFLAQQSRRQRAEEEEYPELNGEQAFMEREAIDNLLDNGSMQEYEDFNGDDDDVYGDELELDESGNVIESSHSRANREQLEEQGQEESVEQVEYDPYAYSEENEEFVDDEYDAYDGMSALTPEQQEELQAELDELEAIEYENFELDFSDEEVPEEGDDLLENPEETNGMRCTSEDECSNEEEVDDSNNMDDNEGTEDSSSSSSSSDDSSSTDSSVEEVGSLMEETGDQEKKSPIPEAMETDEPEKSKTVEPVTAPAPVPPPAPAPAPAPPPRILSSSFFDSQPYAGEVPLPSALNIGEVPRVEFTPPPLDEDDQPLKSSFNIADCPPIESIISIAPTFSGIAIKEERASPSPPEPSTSSTDIQIIEAEDEDSSDSTTTTYSSSGCTSSLSSDSSVFSMEFSEENEEPPVPPSEANIPLMDEDFQMPSTSSYHPSSTSMKPLATSLTVFSEDLPPHKDEEPGPSGEVPPADEIRPPSSTIPSSDRLSHWLANSPSSPQSLEDDMADVLQRRADDCEMMDTVTGSEEIEAELLPAQSLLQRDCPDELMLPRYVRAKHDTKMEHLAEFLHQRAMEEHQVNQTDFDADPVPTIPKPNHFYVFSRNGGHHLKNIFLHETMATALCAMTQGDHLIIFYDIAGNDLRGEKISLLADVVPPHFLSLPTV